MFPLILALTSTVATISDARTTLPQPTPAGQPATFTWGDWDGDGLDDAFIVTPAGEAHLMRNRRDGSFEDVTAQAGLVGLGDVTAAAFGDFDADGKLDLFVGRLNAGDKLYHNAGRGMFEPAEIALKHAGAARFAHWQDYDRDGLVDLHVHTDEGDVLYHNHGATIFERVELPQVERSALPSIPIRAELKNGDLAEERDMSVTDRGISPRDRDGSPAARDMHGRTDARPASSSGGGASAPASGAASGAPGGTHNPAPPPSCGGAPSVQDQSTSSCILASSTPSLGLLYPLSVNLNVDSSGRVGMGTTTPLYKLHVIDAANTGVFGQGGTTGIRGDANLAGAGNRYGGYFTSSGGSNNIGVYGASTIGVFGTGSGYGAYGESNASTGVGLYGKANHSSGNTIGVLAESVSTFGIGLKSLGRTGVYARGNSLGVQASGSDGLSGSPLNPIGVLGNATENATTSFYPGSPTGVCGYTDRDFGGEGYGVIGATGPDVPAGKGVCGLAIAPNSTGVYGLHQATTGTAPAILGESSSASLLAPAVLGRITSATAPHNSAGVQGENLGSGIGVLGTGGGVGVRGVNAGATRPGVHGVFGPLGSYLWPAGVTGGVYTDPGLEHAGVIGYAETATGLGVLGEGSVGVRGRSLASAGTGVSGLHDSSTGTMPGVLGESNSTATGAAAIVARTLHTTPSDTVGVLGLSEPQPFWGIGGYLRGGYVGVRAESTLSGAGFRYGGEFTASGGDGNVYGVYAAASDPQHDGEARAVFGTCSQADGYAGYFAGNVSVSGTLSKGGGSFKIDHPLDPENKNLYHSFVESPDMKNVYDGVARLDAQGEAWVEMPEWFDALNRDFRYQLTALDVPGPMLHVAQRIASNRFRIAGGSPGSEVSWQVTGIRKDRFAEANRIPVEEWKRPEERGLYLHPEAWGVPQERGIDAALHRAPLEAKEEALNPALHASLPRSPALDPIRKEMRSDSTVEIGSRASSPTGSHD